MMRCDVCGRSLVGERADHPDVCRFLRGMAPRYVPRRRVLTEGDPATDPFMQTIELIEGPIQRGA